MRLPSHPQLSGTLSAVADEISRDSGVAFTYELDVSNPFHITRMVETVEKYHGAIDLLVNNASAVDLRAAVSLKKVNLMQAVNARGTLLMNMGFLAQLRASRGQIVSISSPLDDHVRWLDAALPYAMSKYGMTLGTIGWSRQVKANCIWPKRTISTAATRMLEAQTQTPYHTNGRDAEYFVDAIMRLVEHDSSGMTCIDEDLIPNPDIDAPLDMFVDDSNQN